MASRIACLHVPDLPLVALLRAEPDLVGKPVAVTEGSGPQAHILCASPEAAGVRPRMALARARGLCPALLLRCVSQETIRSCLDAVLDLAMAFSPRVQRTAHGVLLEVGDLHHLFATEEDLAAALLGQATGQGLRVQVAIAHSPPTAQVLAVACAGLCVVPYGQERAHLAPLPLSALPLSEVQAGTLARWGLHTAGDLAALPRARLSARLGKAGAVLHALACGEDHTPLVASPVSDTATETLDLEEPLDNLEPLSFLLRGLLVRLVARLALRSLSAQGYELRLSLWPKGVLTRIFSLAVPTREVAALLDLARVALAAQPPQGPVRRIEVIANPAAGRPAQLSLLEPAGPRPEALATTLARLEVLCGQGRVGAPALLDSYLPGQATLLSFSGTFAQQPPLANQRGAALVPHVVRPPAPAKVVLAAGRPASLRMDQAAGPIVQVGGPFRVRVGQGKPVLRDYYEVELDSGALFRLYQDLASGDWFVDGRYV